MNKVFLIVPILSSLILGCSSSTSNSNLDQFVESSGGQVMGDATSFYWVTNKLTRPSKASDYVTVGDYGWYKSDYRWNDGSLRELIRQGEQRNSSNNLIPYRIHIRFNQSNDAVYQQYRLNGRVLPIQTEQLQRYQKEAKAVLERTQEQRSDGLKLIQGYWDGEIFETCSGLEFRDIEFNQTLPSFVINRLSSVDSYAAFLGNKSIGKVSVEQLLMLAEDSQDCIERPVLIKDE